MPFDALSANARLTVPVGAMDSKWLLRMPSRRIAVLDVVGQARSECAVFQITFRVEERKRAAFARQFDRSAIRFVAHQPRDAHREFAAFGRVVAHAQHHERIAETGEADADAPLGARLIVLLWQRPQRDVEHVVEKAHLGAGALCERVPIE